MIKIGVNSLYEAHVKNGLEIQKKQALTEMSISASVDRAMHLADVESEKELQKTLVTFSQEGHVMLKRERFGNNLQGGLPIQIVAARSFSHLDAAEPSVLSIVVKKENGESVCLFWNMQKTETRWIRLPFERNGISFGFGEKKENEIRRKILLAVANIAKTVALPEQHGWYKLDGKWRYAFPGEITWKEVNQHC